MEFTGIRFDSKKLEELINSLNQCTNDYVFIYYFAQDRIYTPDKAYPVFDLPTEAFNFGKDIFKTFIHKDDIDNFYKELKLILDDGNSFTQIEFRLANKTGSYKWVIMKAKKIILEDGEKAIIAGVEVLESKEEKRADHDTKLPLFSQLRNDYENIQKKNDFASGFIIKFDIDNLGIINEQYGTTVGDFVINLVADCLKRASQNIAKVYKFSSDEFACANFYGGTALDARQLYERIKRYIAEIEQKIDYEVMFTVSAGTVAFYNDKSSFEEMLKKINYTLLSAKNGGKNNLKLFNAVEYAKHLKEIALQSRLRDSVKNGFKGFELFYQPFVDAKNLYLDPGKSVWNVIGAEALLRWSCPEFGFVPPDEFIPILEKTGLIIPVGRWILLTGFKQCRLFNKVQKNFHMSLNLSYIQVKKSDIVSDVQMALEKSGCNPENLTLELTESGYMDNAEELQNLVHTFQKMGINVDIDDFGTGYSNLRYLQYLHAEYLKLDYSFVHKATGGDEGDRKVIKYISKMAHELGMKICMEGVETESDVEKLQIYEPDKFQGYYFGRPCNAVDFREHHLRPDYVTEGYKK